MKITIVTACYNAAATIRTALESVAGQRTEARGGRRIEIEHIVVDGGSTDGTVEAVRKLELGIRGEERENFSFKWISEKDNGLYDAINKGIRMATGDVVGILNADDVLASDDTIIRIAEAFEGLGGSGSLDCVYGKIRFVNDRGGLEGSGSLDVEGLRKLKTARRCFAKLWRPWMLQWGYMPPHPGVFIRRERFAEWGMYVPERTEYKIAADYELLIRYFRVHKMRARYSGICTTVMRTGGVSTRDVNARKILNEEIIKANRANGYFCCWPMLLPKYAIKIWEVILPRLGFDGRKI